MQPQNSNAVETAPIGRRLQLQARRRLLDPPVDFRGHTLQWVAEYRVLVDGISVSPWKSLAPLVYPGHDVDGDYDIYASLSRTATDSTVTAEALEATYRRALQTYRRHHHDAATPPWAISCGTQLITPTSWVIG